MPVLNYFADPWFAEHHAHRITIAFAHWWEDFYGAPGSYEDTESEQHEYWVRCAFALQGWYGRDRLVRDPGILVPDE